MIFNISGHIEMIRNGLNTTDNQLYFIQDYPVLIVKTQSRRPKRGVYQVEAERKKPHKIGYAVQHKRGVKAEPDIRIVMDRIWEEYCYQIWLCIHPTDAFAEGGYKSDEFERVFRELNPEWNGKSRWAFEFHVVEVRR